MQTIAIIDDDIHIGDMLEEALRKECYNVIRAYSGNRSPLSSRKQKTRSHLA